MPNSKSILRGCAVAALIGAIALWAWDSRDPTAPELETAATTATTLPARGKIQALVQQPAVTNLGATTEEAGRSPDSKKEKLSLVKRMENGKMLSPDPAKLAAYLHENSGNAEALLTVSRLTNNLPLLRQAAQSNPGDPRIQLDLAVRGDTPEERLEALNRLRELAPDNALVSYLSAREQFQRGDSDAAIAALNGIGNASQLNDYVPESIQSAEEAYLAVGYTPAEAKAAAVLGLARPQLKSLNELSKSLAELRQSYAQAGDLQAASTVGQLGTELGRRLQNQSPFIIDELVGIAVETRLLKQSPAEAAINATGQTAGERLAELGARRKEINTLAAKATPALNALTDASAMTYFDRQKVYGEVEALRWLAKRNGQ